MLYILRPGLKGRDRWAGRMKPPPSGSPVTGPVYWQPPYQEVSIRKGPKADLVVCSGGPYHNMRIKRYFYAKTGQDEKKRAKVLVDTLPDKFVVKPYAGRYEWDKEKEQYIWIHGMNRPMMPEPPKRPRKKKPSKELPTL